MPPLSERHLQEAVWRLLSDPGRLWTTASGKRLQILAPGELNVHEGPDFRDMVLLLEGTICVGDGEFHRSLEQWYMHGHHRDPRYSRVILHILTTPVSHPPAGLAEILVIPEAELLEVLQRPTETAPGHPDLSSLHELQYFALLRLLRHTAEARAHARQWGFEEGFLRFVEDFLHRYLAKRRRPVHTRLTLEALLQALPRSPFAQLVSEFRTGPCRSLAQRLQEVMRQRIATEGLHLRLEILLNCLVPYLLAHAEAEQRTELLSWYWSARACVSYGSLRRRFPELPQQYMWQQQGMLEFLRQRGSGVLCRELLISYRFGDLLEFYRTAETFLRP